MKLDYRTWIILTLILILILFIVGGWIWHNNQISNARKKFDQNYVALQDSLKKELDDEGDTVYVDKSPEVNPEDIKELEIYKQLEKKTQRYIDKLSNVENLLSATRAKLESQRELIDSFEYDNKNVASSEPITDEEGIKFEYGDSLKFSKDKGHFTYDEFIAFERGGIYHHLKPKYRLTLSTQFTRNEDNSIDVTWKVNDPNVKITEGQSLTVPPQNPNRIKKGWRIVIGILSHSVAVGIGYGAGQLNN